MFLRQDAPPTSSLRPASSQIAPPDWEVLARFWYPVAQVSEIGEKPVKVTLLDVDLVLFRGAQGVAVVLDRCPHRHVRLSAGHVEKGEIICPYHALAFDETGRCTHVPAVGHGARLPASYRVASFPVEI